MGSSKSITRRLTSSVLLLELVAALVLIGTVTNHERRVQFLAFDANLRATSNALLGAVQEADSKDGSIRLDLHGLEFPTRAVFRVIADDGQLLGERGNVPALTGNSGTALQATMADSPYRFYVLKGERVIDPNSPRAVIHRVTVTYGLPEGRTWHAIFESTRFFAVATILLLGITAVLMSWLVRRSLQPIRELADEAERIDADHWVFASPASSRQFTELLPLASAIEKTIARLQHSFEQQRRFTSDAAHELKTDIAIVKSAMQLLTMRRRTAEEYEHGMALTRNDIGRLEATVQKMLTLARLEQGPRSEKQECDLSKALEDAVSQSLPYAHIKDVQIVFEELQSGMRTPLASEDAFLLCSNVIINAIQHSPEGGLIEIELTQDTHASKLRVRDHGEGIQDEDRPHLFDAFYRGDTSRSRKSGGTGLGLSICKAICDRVGGSIGIANHTAGGAEALIQLPNLTSEVESDLSKA